MKPLLFHQACYQSCFINPIRCCFIPLRQILSVQNCIWAILSHILSNEQYSRHENRVVSRRLHRLFFNISPNVVYSITFVSFSAVIAIKKRKKSPLPFYLLFFEDSRCCFNRSLVLAQKSISAQPKSHPPPHLSHQSPVPCPSDFLSA